VASIAGTCPNIKGFGEDTRAKLSFSIFFCLPSYGAQKSKLKRLVIGEEVDFEGSRF